MKYIIIAIIILFSGCSNNDNSKQQKPITNFIINEANGSKFIVETKDNRIKIKEFENKIILIDFFSTKCPPCRAEIPHLISLYNKYKDDLVVISVLVEDKNIKEIRDFIDIFGINYPVTDAGANYIFTDVVGGVDSIPAMYLYDKSGKYFIHYIGAVPEAMIENDIKRILNTK